MGTVTASLNVTVACSSCAAEVGFPGRVCPSCHKALPSELADELERRLEAADEDFRDARTDLRSAGSILLVVGLWTLLAAVGRYLIEITAAFASSEDKIGAAMDLVIQLVLGSVLLACAGEVRYRPRLAVAAGLLVWLSVQVALTIQAPLTALPFGFGGFLFGFLRLGVFLLLVRGVIAAVRGQAIIARMTR
jgi:hypothetical protein